MSPARPGDLGLRRGIARLTGTVAADRLFLLVLALLLFAAGLGLRDPWPADEPRFALIARDMVHSGNWLIPRVGGELYADKPPLFMWCTAAFYWLTGSIRIAFLMPSLLAGVGTLALVYELGRRLWNRRIALYAGLLLLLIIQFTLQARTAQLDALVSFWTTLGLYGLVVHLLQGPRWRWYVTGWFAMGLGVITKGVGFLPVFVLLPWAVVRLRWPAHCPTLRGSFLQWAAGPVAMLAAIGLWVIPMLLYVYWVGTPELIAYREELLWQQTATRYADSWAHVQPIWYYVTDVIPWAWLPASIALPWLVPAWWRRLGRGDPAIWLLVGWIVCVLVFFTLSPGKRGVYLLPAVPALALATAPFAPGLLRLRGLHWLALLVVALVAAVAVAGLAFVYVVEPDRAADLADTYGVAPWGLLGAIALLALPLVWVGYRGRGMAALAVLLIGLWQLYGWWAGPVLNSMRSASGLMAMVDAHQPPDTELAVVDWKEQFLLQAESPVYHFGFRRDGEDERRDALAWVSKTDSRRLMIAASDMEPCFDPAKAVSIAYRHRHDWMLAGRDALTGACDIPEEITHVRRYEPARGN